MLKSESLQLTIDNFEFQLYYNFKRLMMLNSSHKQSVDDTIVRITKQIIIYCLHLLYTGILLAFQKKKKINNVLNTFLQHIASNTFITLVFNWI